MKPLPNTERRLISATGNSNFCRTITITWKQIAKRTPFDTTARSEWVQEVWTSSQLSLLEPLARRRTVKRGGVLFKAGQRDMGLAVVLRGEVQIVEQRDGIEQELAVGHERDFIGDVAMLQGTSALATARVTSDEAEILYVPAAELQRALAELPKVSKPIVDALIMRRRRCVAIASLQDCVCSLRAARGMPISSTIFWIRTTSHIV